MEKGIWIKQHKKADLKDATAIVGAPGLRSIGKLVVDELVKQKNAEPLADLYSTHMPSIYETKPAYAAHPAMPGLGGVIIEQGTPDLPKVQFYANEAPKTVFVRGYHANFEGQYDVASKVADFLFELQVKRVIVVAGYGAKQEPEKKLCCAGTDASVLEELKTKYGVDIGYKGPFMGFSGLVFGLSKLRGIQALCLFASTQPTETDLEAPDNDAAKIIIDKLNQMIQ
ncbi:MAG: PAC2 family protein [Candidatus Bathyarchaeota archaeon]|nr:PAC2 family protein [Candidatus Bathyarchaeota archaeon]